jgi:uncharacterized protein YeaO (DUF488 family)
MAAIDVRRVYDDRSGHSGEYRVLVDRLWPRGVAKESLELDQWVKELAPSAELRRWYGHEPERFEEFRRRYRDELSQPEAKQAATNLVKSAGRSRLVLLTATKDVDHSGAVVLAEHLRRRRR